MSGIFLSYAHVDNETPDEDYEGWVSKFCKTLESYLRQEAVIDQRVWRDSKDIRPYEQFSLDILDGLTTSELLISVLSPVYVTRDWCLRELQEFGNMLDGSDPRAKERIFKVVKKRLSDREDTPDFLKGSEGYKFYTIDRENDREIPFYLPGKKPDYRFFDTVHAIAQDIEKKIRELSDLDPTSGSDTLEYERHVFLAYSTEDMALDMRKIRGELADRNIAVWPPANSIVPVSSKHLDAELEQYLSKCDLAIHCLGNTPGHTPDGTDVTVSEYQLEKTADANIQRVVWLPAGRDRNSVMSTIVDDLLDGTTMVEDDELVEEGLDRFIGHLLTVFDSADDFAQREINLESLRKLMPAEMIKAMEAMSKEDLGRFLENLRH